MKWHLLSESEFFLPQLLIPYHFHSADIQALFKNYPPQTGTIITSKTHQLLVNRDHWLVSPLHTEQNHPTYLLQGDEGILENEYFRLIWKITSTPPYPELSFNPEEVTLEIPASCQELNLRYWQEGDRFTPLGMKGEKKLSDFFIDSKIDLNKKNNIPLLCIDNKIAWICGLRPSELFKRTNSPQKVLWARFEDRSMKF